MAAGRSFRYSTDKLEMFQIKIMKGIVSLQETYLKDKKNNVLKHFDEVNYTIDMDTVLDEKELKRIRQDMYSRKPIVLDRNDPAKK